jgi:PEP-CTERM/exosortase A-associated glycosyltransferase
VRVGAHGFEAVLTIMALRILHLLDHSIPLHSGYTFRTLSILKEQRRRGWETFHLTSPKQLNCTVAEEDVDGWHFYRTPAPAKASTLPGLGELALMRAVQARVDELFDRIRPHVIHAHSPVLNAIPALRSARKRGIPVLYEVRAFWEDAAVDHGTTSEGSLRYRLTRAMETYALKRVDAVTTICEGLRADIVARGVPASKVTVIPNAVDIEKFQQGGTADAALAAELGLEGKLVIGFLGSFYAYEGLDLLIEALPALKAAHPTVCLLLVGGGPQEAALRALAQSKGVSDSVRFVGRVPHDQVNRYYDLVDILAYPRHSMRLTELVTPLKPLEAMAQGRLLIASDVGGHRELIADGATGFLFKSGDPQALVGAVGRVLAARPEWPRLKAQARTFVEQERNWAKSVSNYQAIFDRLAPQR